MSSILSFPIERQAIRLVETARSLPPVFPYMAHAPSASDAVVQTLPHPSKFNDHASSSDWIPMSCGNRGTIIDESDIVSLPPPVQRYFQAVGVVGKPRVASFSCIMEGQIRNSADSPWMPIVMRQYNRLDNPARVVYIESPGKPMAGIDSFIEGSGRMLIKLFGLVTITDSRGAEMSQSALVTFINDLVLCPVGYFSLPLEWKPIDDRRSLMRLSHAGMTVTAELIIDESGRMLNWAGGDRYAYVKGKLLSDRWSTPFSEKQQELAGLRIPVSGVGVHDYDGSSYIYIELNSIRNLTLNANSLPIGN